MARARRKTNGRFSRTKTTRRRKKQPIKVSQVAQQYIIANAITRGMAGTNLVPFLTEGWLRPVTAGGNYGSGNSWRFSLAELVQGVATGDYGMSSQWANMDNNMMAALKKNLKENGAMMAFTVIGTPILFKFGKKILNKPIILPANRLLRSAGIREVKV
jgi:hypothetical protein